MKIPKHIHLMFFMSFATCVYAKSPCYTLATSEFFKSGLQPTVSTPENLQEANEELADSETYCKRLVQAVITQRATTESIRTKADMYLAEAKNEFAKDGDMDKLEYAKYMYALTIGSARIAEEMR